MKTRTKVILGVVGVIIVLAAIGAVVGPKKATLDPQAGTKLAGNIALVCTAPAPDWCAALQANPVEMQDTIAFIHFAPRMDGAPIAEQTCHTIAAITNDGDTAKPLGITSVVVYANGKTVAQCFPPPVTPAGS